MATISDRIELVVVGSVARTFSADVEGYIRSAALSVVDEPGDAANPLGLQTTEWLELR